MARFRGTVQGSRGTASRLGHGTIRTNTNGWELGVEVDGFKINPLTEVDDSDVFDVWVTGGSNDRLRKRLLVSISTAGGKRIAVFGDEFGGQTVTLED